MQVIRSPADAAAITDAELRHLIEKTIRDLSEDHPYDPDELGYFLIVQPGDSLDAINAQVGFEILTNRWTGIKFGQSGFSPSFEFVVQHGGYFEMVFVLSDDGMGITVFLAQAAEVDPDLLEMCAAYSEPSGVC